jgi:hypothetical protein
LLLSTALLGRGRLLWGLGRRVEGKGPERACPADEVVELRSRRHEAVGGGHGIGGVLPLVHVNAQVLGQQRHGRGLPTASWALDKQQPLAPPPAEDIREPRPHVAHLLLVHRQLVERRGPVLFSPWPPVARVLHRWLRRWRSAACAIRRTQELLPALHSIVAVYERPSIWALPDGEGRREFGGLASRRLGGWVIVVGVEDVVYVVAGCGRLLSTR